MASIFTKIINGQIPAFKITENDEFLAILDAFPLVKGHVLVIPKTEIDYIFAIDDDQLARMNIFAKRVALALEKAVPCKRVGVVVIGLEVAHAHIHLMPLNSGSEVNFERPKIKVPDHENAAIVEAIKLYL